MRLLLAEDERELSNALCAILKHSNYSVDAVYNGQDALDYLLCGEYDGAVLDIMMPKMDGITVVKKVREQGLSLPILLLTARAEIDDRVEGLDSGADDYLTKPFATKELLARIRAMTRRKGETTDNVLRFENLSLDRSTCTVSTETGGVRLPAREFQMLEMLMIQPGQIVSAEQFMEKIWGCDSDSELNVVWVHLSNLRKRLVSLQARVRIRAARGLGYCLEAGND